MHLRAKSFEDESISRIYRLISRSVHALTLIGLLSSLQAKWKLKIDWAILSELLSFRSFVVSSKTHDAVRRLLNGLIDSACRSDRPGESAAVNNMINMMTEQCYHYFSTLRVKIAQKQNPLIQDNEGEGVAQLMNETVQLLLLSAKHWNSIDFVVGNESTLRSRCAELLTFQSRIGRCGVVDLCLTAAGGFSQVNVAPDSEKWDIGLYHGGVAINDADLKKAIGSCYQCIADCIVNLRTATDAYEEGLGTVERAMLEMIEYAISNSRADEALHNALYSYYEQHGEFIKASNLMSIIA
eukprot:gene33405-43182_t